MKHPKCKLTFCPEPAQEGFYESGKTLPFCREHQEELRTSPEGIRMGLIYEQMNGDLRLIMKSPAPGVAVFDWWTRMEAERRNGGTP